MCFAGTTAESDDVKKVFVTPGNAVSTTENINIVVTNIAYFVAFAKQESINLTIVGPEMPLLIGLVDAFKKVKTHHLTQAPPQHRQNKPLRPSLKTF